MVETEQAAMVETEQAAKREIADPEHAEADSAARLEPAQWGVDEPAANAAQAVGTSTPDTPAPAADPTIKQRVPRKLAEIIPSQLLMLQNYYDAVLATDEVEAIHKMRVTTRRLQASLDLLEGELKVRRLKRRLRRWRRMLSTVRNYDVFLSLLEHERSSRRGARREHVELLRRLLQRRRLQRVARVRTKLARIDVINDIGGKLGLTAVVVEGVHPTGDSASEATGTVEAISDPAGDSARGGTEAVEAISDPAGDSASEGTQAVAAIADPAGDSASEESEAWPDLSNPGETTVFDLQNPADNLVDGFSFTPEAGNRLAIAERAVFAHAANRLEQRMAEFNALVAQSHPTTDPVELHQLRIAAKRVRYLLEIVTEMGFGDATAALAWLKALQDRIGDWHDLEALEQEIIRIVSGKRFLREHLLDSGRMLLVADHLQKKKIALATRLFPMRVSRTVTATSRRVVRLLRRSANAGTRPQRAAKSV